VHDARRCDTDRAADLGHVCPRMLDAGYGWCHRWYHIAVNKTTVYLPEELKRSLRNLAAASGRSEADLIREAIAARVQADAGLRPRGQLFESGDRSLAESAEEALAGFGER
jgi:plasmid stability protein